MYLARLKTMLKEALSVTFDADYPEPDFRNINVSLEYPVRPQDYPGIWVDYEDTQPLRTAGVDHSEVDLETSQRIRRWKFAGYATYTVVALTSLERDRLFDELVRVLAFGDTLTATRDFRSYIERNEFIAANFDFDEIEVRGNAAAPGTPWGSDEIIYERTLNMEVVGEVVSDSATGLLVPLSAIKLLPAALYFGENAVPEQDTGQGLSTDWH
jgi:hypothetical protein